MNLQASLFIVFLSELYCKETVTALKEEYYWRMPEFQFPNSSAKNEALSTGSYIPENNVVFTVGAWKDKIFVSIFRAKVGVASSFNYFLTNCGTKSPILIPYPSFDANYINEDPKSLTLVSPSESSIVSAPFFRIDYKCDRLWIIDAGLVGIFNPRRVVSQPAVIIFNLNTNKLIRRYTIPAKFINSESTFRYLEIDIKGASCKNAYAYISDAFRSIVVYSFKKNRSWRLTHNYFGSDPDAVTLSYDGTEYHFNYGISGISLGEHHEDGSRRVYINVIASTKTFYISNNVLQNEAYIALNNYFCDVQILGSRNDVHVYDYAYDEKSNVLFSTEFNRKRIGCWNTSKRYNQSNFDIVFQGKKLFCSAAINMDVNRNLWMVTNNYLRFLVGSWNPNDTNMRVYKGKVDNIISRTVCEK